MDTGFPSESNGIGDDGSKIVAQVRTPSTPFESDMNPLYDFPFTNREDVVTVKNIEEIVQAVKDSFSRFIETQRNYLDNLNSTTDNSENSSKNSVEADASSTQQPTSKTNDSGDGLTKATNSDIIGPNSFTKVDSPVYETLTSPASNDEISSSLTSLTEKITENLTDDSTDEEKESELRYTDENIQPNNDEILSLFDYMSLLMSETKDKNDDILEMSNDMSKMMNSLIDINSKTDENDNIKVSDNINSGLVDEDYVFEKEDKGILGQFTVDEENESSAEDDINDIDILSKSEDTNGISNGIGEDEDDFSGENTEESSKSIADIILENNRIIEEMSTDMDNVCESIYDAMDGGLAESIVEMLLQDSWMEMIASDVMEGVSSMISERIDEDIANAISTFRNDMEPDENPQEREEGESVIREDVEEPEPYDTNRQMTEEEEGESPEGISKYEWMSEIGDGQFDDESTETPSSVATNSDIDDEKSVATETTAEKSSSIMDRLHGVIGHMMDSVASFFNKDVKNVESEDVETSDEDFETEHGEYPYESAMDSKYSEMYGGDMYGGEEYSDGEDSPSGSMSEVINESGFGDSEVREMFESLYSENSLLFDRFDDFSERMSASSEDEGMEMEDDSEEIMRQFPEFSESNTSPVFDIHSSMGNDDIGNVSNESMSPDGGKTENSENDDSGLILGNREIMVGRFDRIEKMIGSISGGEKSTGGEGGGGTAGSMVISRNSSNFEVDRIG